MCFDEYGCYYVWDGVVMLVCVYLCVFYNCIDCIFVFMCELQWQLSDFDFECLIVSMWGVDVYRFML